MDIVRNADGTLVGPSAPARHHESEDGVAAEGCAGEGAGAPNVAVTTRTLHPGEGGYDEALSEWDLQQNPDREPAISTVSGRQEAMSLVHTVADLTR